MEFQREREKVGVWVWVERKRGRVREKQRERDVETEWEAFLLHRSVELGPTWVEFYREAMGGKGTFHIKEVTRTKWPKTESERHHLRW